MSCYNQLTQNDQEVVCKKGNLVLSTELTMLVSHRKEIRKVTFRALALRRSESRNCGLCLVYIQREELRYWMVPGNVKNNRIN